MPSTYSTSLRIELIADNEQSGIWGQTTNRNLTQVFEETIVSTAEVDVTAGDVTLTAVNGATDQARRPFIRIIGSPVVARQVNVPDVTKLYMVQNTTGQSVTVKPTGQTGVTLLAGQFGYVRCRQGLSAQLTEFLTTVSGNLTVPGTLTVNGVATFNSLATHNAAINVTAASGALNILSGNAAQSGYLTIGRTAVESAVGISGGASQLVTGDVAGDFSIRNSSGRILFAAGGFAPQVWVNTAGLGVGIAPTSPLHALLTANSVYSAVDMVASGVVSNLRNATTTNGTAAVLRFDVNGSASSAVAAIACVHAGDGASVLTFGTRQNAASNIVEALRIDSVRNVGIGRSPAGEILETNRALSVHGSLQSATGPKFALDYAADVSRMLAFGSTTGTTGSFAWYQASSNNSVNRTAMVLDNAGRLGVARTPTTHIFEVSGTGAFGYVVDQAVRLIHNDAYLAFWNTANSVRSGYLQMTSTGTAVWANEIGGTTTTNISVGGSTRLSIDNTGITNIAAGSGFLRMGGNVTRVETNHGIVVINAAFANGVHRRPDSIRVTLECLTAEAGYSVGQHVDWQPMRPGFTGGWWAFSNTAGTQMTVQTLNATIQLPNLAGGAATNITPANWNIRIYYLFL